MNQKSEVKDVFMKRAIALSRENMERGQGGPFGAVIVKDGVIVGEGWNKVTSHNDPTAHAEVEAIRQACQKLGVFSLAGCEIYTSCEPCPMCLAAIYWARLDAMFYANTREDAAKIQFDDDLIYKEVSLPLNQRKILTRQLLRTEALKVFESWEKKENKIRY
jgi:tRNA(Arg) A34 adenosine deaminase TadA